MLVEERPHRMFLLLRSASQEPIDDLEYDYLVHLAHDFEMYVQGARKKESEHRIAQTLQAGMRSSLASVPGITSDCLYSSATKQALVGGDFYTLIRLPDDRVVMILGDVSGKGVEAASMSALVKTALSAYAWEGMGPQRMARSLNSMLMGFSRLETFATMFIAKIDLRQGYATYCSAGHPPSMLVHAPSDGAQGDISTAEIELMSVQSGVVGAFETMSYEAGSFEFSPGDILFMYTDGAIEARDPRVISLASNACAIRFYARLPLVWMDCAGACFRRSIRLPPRRWRMTLRWWRCASTQVALASWLLLGGSLSD